MADRPIRPICIVIAAMGGQGGGVLSNWIVDVGEHGVDAVVLKAMRA